MRSSEIAGYRHLVVTATVSATVMALTTASFRLVGVDRDVLTFAAIAFVASGLIAALWSWVRPERIAGSLLGFFLLLTFCLPIVYSGSLAFSLAEHGYVSTLEKNNRIDWPLLLSRNIFHAFPAWLAGAVTLILLERRRWAQAHRRSQAHRAQVEAALRKDWASSFWVEAVAQLNVAVIAGAVMGTGALANRLAAWFTLFALVAFAVQISIWILLRRQLHNLHGFWLGALISLPFVNWGRFPTLQEHGIEAVGGGIGMWSIALLVTAVLSSKLRWASLTVLALSTFSVAMGFFRHQHADGWFEQATIAFIVGGFCLVFAIGAHVLYRAGAEANLKLAASRSRERAARRLVERETSRRRQILRAIGHDLRQPLSALQLWLFKAKQTPEALTGEELDDAIAAVAASQEFLDGAGQLAWLSEEEEPPRFAPVEVDPLIRELVADTRQMARAAGIGVRIRTIEAEVLTDSLLFRRILRNLIVNAIKHAGRGELLVAVRRRGTHAEFLVIDQGPGISVEEQERLFEEFSRSEASMSEGGLGIGLFVASDLAQSLGHDLRLRSRPGKGTCFILRAALWEGEVHQ